MCENKKQKAKQTTENPLKNIATGPKNPTFFMDKDPEMLYKYN